jgi:hypothetical protein
LERCRQAGSNSATAAIATPTCEARQLVVEEHSVGMAHVVNGGLREAIRQRGRILAMPEDPDFEVAATTRPVRSTTFESR